MIYPSSIYNTATPVQTPHHHYTMHQHPRPSIRTAASAATPHTNPSRSSNTRDTMSSRTYSSEDLSSGSQTVRSTDGKEQSVKDRANLVVQHFFTKAALIICSSRVSLPPAMSRNGEAKIDRWVRTFPCRLRSPTNAVCSLDHRSYPYCSRETVVSWLALRDLEPGGYNTARHSCVSESWWSLSCVILEDAAFKDSHTFPLPFYSALLASH